MQKHPILIIAFLLFLNGVYSQKPTVKSVTLSVSSMKGLPRPKSASRGETLDPDIKLVILNNTDTVTRFYKTWNLWGDDAIRLELTVKDSVFTLYYSGFCSSNNFPAAETVPPGDSMVIYLKIEKCY